MSYGEVKKDESYAMNTIYTKEERDHVAFGTNLIEGIFMLSLDCKKGN